MILGCQADPASAVAWSSRGDRFVTPVYTISRPVFTIRRSSSFINIHRPSTIMVPPTASSTISGANLVAAALARQNIHTVFGLIGIPVIEIGQACVDIGIRFIAFRNEQSAAYVSVQPCPSTSEWDSEY
jgi:hypothetical protein